MSIFHAIWFHLYNLKNVKNAHEGVLLKPCNFTKSNTPPWVFFTFFKIVQMVPDRAKHHKCKSIIWIAWLIYFFSV